MSRKRQNKNDNSDFNQSVGNTQKRANSAPFSNNSLQDDLISDAETNSVSKWNDVYGIAQKSELTKTAESKGFIANELLFAELGLNISFIITQVKLQAYCFARAVMNSGIEAYKLTGKRNPTEQLQAISELWVYSLFKGYVCGVYSLTNPITLSGPLIEGHAMLYSIIRNGSTTMYNTDGPTVRRDLNVPESANLANIKRLTEAFMACRVAYESIGPDGNISVPYLDNMLIRINSYVLNLDGVGKVKIVTEVSNTAYPELTNPLTSPIGSSFYGKNSSTQLYVANDSSDTLMHDSIIFGKSLGISFSNFTSSYTETSVSPPSCCSLYEISSSDPFIHHEVTLLSGLMTTPPGILDNISAHELPRAIDDPKFIVNSRDFGSRDWFPKPEPKDRSIQT